MPGLLVNGKEHPVQDLIIINSHDVEWCRLDQKDYRSRPTSWVRQIILHTTKGDWPQRVLPGRGAGGRARVVADGWRSEPVSSAAHLVIDNDGTVACLCDLATVEAYHATVSNPWSIGIEMYQEGCSDGHYGVHEAVYEAAVKLVPALCRIFGIQFQIPKLPYKNEPLRRMADGGESCVGVFGHRDNTGQRGFGDPGDEIFARLAAAGAERFDHNAGEDLDVWKGRQQRAQRQRRRLDGRRHSGAEHGPSARGCRSRRRHLGARVTVRWSWGHGRDRACSLPRPFRLSQSWFDRSSARNTTRWSRLACSTMSASS